MDKAMIVYFLIVLAALDNAAATTFNSRDVEALLSFKKAITSDPLGSLSNWTPENSANVCSWEGITCLDIRNRAYSNRVFMLRLSAVSLEGTLSPTLGNLPCLSSLDLSSNNLSGRIPGELGSLKWLQDLELSSNNLNGRIPRELGSLPALQVLDLSFNNLSGRIPRELGSLPMLSFLRLSSNNLSGRIPRELCSWHLLFSPDKLHKNYVNYTAILPHRRNRTTLAELSLFDNKLSGTIPENIGKCVSLSTLDLSRNLLNGTIPASLQNCTQLSRLKLFENKLSGSLDIVFPISLDVFSAHSNNFSGNLPSSLANCTQLIALDLRKNKLIGQLPKQYASFQSLRVLSLGYNNLQGGISNWITNLPQLQVLDLSNNNFTGRIPFNLGRLLGFQIPPSSQRTINDSSTFYTDVQVIIKGHEYSLTYVLLTNTILDLSSNNFIGEIPSSMANLSGLRLLNLSRNHLEGKILASLSEISSLEQLDLSKNNLSGEIPQELCKLTMLAYLNVSFNTLCGRIPEGRQMDTFSVASFQRNKCLCGYPLQACNKADGDGVSPNVSDDQGWLNRVDEHISLIALGLGYGLGFGGVVTVIIMWDKAWHWMVPPKIKPFYGVYRFPK